MRSSIDQYLSLTFSSDHYHNLSMCDCGACYTSAIYKSCFVPKVTWLRMYATVFLFWMLVNHTLMLTGKLRWKLCSQNLKKKCTSVINNYRLNAGLMRPCLSKFWWCISPCSFYGIQTWSCFTREISFVCKHFKFSLLTNNLVILYFLFAYCV